MRNDPFEQDLADLFAVPPAFDDGEAFVRRGMERMAGFERLRQRVLLGVGVIAAVAAGLMAARLVDWAGLTARSESLGTLAANTNLTTWCVIAAVIAGVALLANRQTLRS
jgi:hypothetical protein